MDISRREFLKYLGITSAGVSLTGLGCDSIWSVPNELYEKVGGAPRIETWKTSVCSLCPGGCGIKVRLIDGIPVRILGNPIHPVNRAGICPMAEAGIELLFNPNRIREPLKRVGVRGENRWESITWKEAVRTIVSRLQELRKKGESHKLAFWSDHKANLLPDLIERFMQAYGSINLHHFGQSNSPTVLTYLSQGHKKPLAYNFKDTKLLINFGADLLDVGPSPVRFNQLYSELRNRQGGSKARIIHIDSRLSRTACNSDEWVPIQPGTMAALALGMANVLIKDDQYDREFVKTNSFGFEDWQDEQAVSHQGFKSVVIQEYYPEKVAEVTGVPAAKIVELAREFAGAESALVLAGGQAANSTNSLYTLWAIDCLNALKGNYNKGGCISTPEEPLFAELPKAQIDEIAERGLSQPGLTPTDSMFCFPEYAVEYLPNMILNKQPYPIEVLFLANVNPVFNSTNQDVFTAALKEVPFIVSFSSFLDETSVYADLILPDHVFFEKYEIFYNTPLVEFSHLGVQQPVIDPLYNTRHLGDVILEIAHGLGGTIASSLTWPDYKEYLQFRLNGIYEIGAGTIFTEGMDETWLKFLKERGWQIFEYTTFEEFWDVLLEKGGWWNPFPSTTDFGSLFATPSKKFEFYSQNLEREVLAQIQDERPLENPVNQVLEKWHIEARGDLAFMPHYEPASFPGSDGEFEVHLIPYNLIMGNGGVAHLPLMQELFGLFTREYWRSWAEMNPNTAHKYGIVDGDLIKVHSPKGSLIVKMKLLPSVMPEVLHIPFGLGHEVYDRSAKGPGVNPYNILVQEHDALSGMPSLISTKVKLEKVINNRRT